MKKKKIYKANLLYMDFKCLDCGTVFVVEKDDVRFYVSSTPCELCGSHGSAEASVECPHCKNNVTVELHTW